MDLQDVFDNALIKPGDKFPRLNSTIDGRDYNYFAALFRAADPLLRALDREGFRIKVVKQELTVCSLRRRERAFYAKAMEDGRVVSFNFNAQDSRLAHILLAGVETKQVNNSPRFYCFHRTTAPEIDAFVKLVREAE